mgnify:CR=1 FL=1
MNITSQCHERESRVLADLRQRDCEVCQPTLTETVDSVSVCEDVLTDDCHDDPLVTPWTKYCDTTSDWSSNGVRFMFESDHRKDGEDLTTTTLRTTESTTEDVSDILDFINQQIIAELDLLLISMKANAVEVETRV